MVGVSHDGYEEDDYDDSNPYGDVNDMERDVLYVPESNIQDSEFEDGEQDEEEIEGEE